MHGGRLMFPLYDAKFSPQLFKSIFHYITLLIVQCSRLFSFFLILFSPLVFSFSCFCCLSGVKQFSNFISFFPCGVICLLPHTYRRSCYHVTEETDVFFLHGIQKCRMLIFIHTRTLLFDFF